MQNSVKQIYVHWQVNYDYHRADIFWNKNVFAANRPACVQNVIIIRETV